jgi:hypothetical protein
MNGNILSKAFVFGLLVIVCSCKTRKQLVNRVRAADSTAATSAGSVGTKLAQISAAQNHFHTFSGKAKAKLNINGNTNDVTFTIRISHDQKIWVSIAAIAGIEVGRALITPDSIIVINRLQGIYLKKPFSYVYRYTSRQVNYSTVEALLIGNAVPDLLNENDQLQADNGNVNISGNMGDLAYRLVAGPDLKISSTQLINEEAGQSLLANNNAFTPSPVRVMPLQIDIASTSKDQKIQLNLRYFKVDFDQPQDYPFTIPDRYEPQQ